LRFLENLAIFGGFHNFNHWVFVENWK